MKWEQQNLSPNRTVAHLVPGLGNTWRGGGRAKEANPAVRIHSTHKPPVGPRLPHQQPFDHTILCLDNPLPTTLTTEGKLPTGIRYSGSQSKGKSCLLTGTREKPFTWVPSRGRWSRAGLSLPWGLGTAQNKVQRAQQGHLGSTGVPPCPG